MDTDGRFFDGRDGCAAIDGEIAVFGGEAIADEADLSG